MVYGLADVAADVQEGYAAGKKESRITEADKMKLDSMRSQLMGEGFKESMQRLAMGDTEGATQTWNKTGKHRIKDLLYDQKTGMVTWTSVGTGQQHQRPMRELAGVAGVTLPATQAEIAAKRKHELRLTRQRTGAGAGTTMTKNVEYLARYVTGGDKKKAIKLYNMAKASPQRAYLLALKNLNENPMTMNLPQEEKEKLAAASARSATEFAWGEVLPQEKGMPAPTPGIQAPGIQAPGAKTPSPAHIDILRKNPTSAAIYYFEKRFGKGSAQQYMTGK